MSKYNSVLKYLDENSQNSIVAQGLARAAELDADSAAIRVARDAGNTTTLAAISKHKNFKEFKIVNDLILDKDGYINDDRYEGKYEILLIDDVDDFIANLNKVKKAFQKYE